MIRCVPAGSSCGGSERLAGDHRPGRGGREAVCGARLQACTMIDSGSRAQAATRRGVNPSAGCGRRARLRRPRPASGRRPSWRRCGRPRRGRRTVVSTSRSGPGGSAATALRNWSWSVWAAEVVRARSNIGVSVGRRVRLVGRQLALSGERTQSVCTRSRGVFRTEPARAGGRCPSRRGTPTLPTSTAGAGRPLDVHDDRACRAVARARSVVPSPGRWARPSCCGS